MAEKLACSCKLCVPWEDSEKDNRLFHELHILFGQNNLLDQIDWRSNWLVPQYQKKLTDPKVPEDQKRWIRKLLRNIKDIKNCQQRRQAFCFRIYVSWKHHRRIFLLDFCRYWIFSNFVWSWNRNLDLTQGAWPQSTLSCRRLQRFQRCWGRDQGREVWRILLLWVVRVQWKVQRWHILRLWILQVFIYPLEDFV